MKKIILCVLACSIFNTSFLITSDSIFSYIGTLEFNELSVQEKAPSIPLYYKGQQISVENQSYIITDPQKLSSFTLIIALIDKPTANTITHFTVPKNKPYLLITTTRKTKQFALKKGEMFEDTWIIKNRKGIGPFTIPKDALLVLIDPICIADIKNNFWLHDGIITKLPTLVFKENLKNCDAYAQSILTNLDIRSFHGQTKQITFNQTAKSESWQRVAT